MNASFRELISVIILAAALAGQAYAEAGRCAHCGCHAECQKTCRLVCEEKKVEVFCWACKSEPFCVPGPCKPGCQHCETVCDDCASGDASTPHAEPKRFVWFDWLPGYAKTYTRTKLMRKTVTVKVPTHKWVVEDMCSQCASQQAAANEALIAQLPTATDATTAR